MVLKGTLPSPQSCVCVCGGGGGALKWLDRTPFG